FSVVAPMKVTQRFSTAGSSASCCALLKRCTSSTKSTVWRPVMPSWRRASSMAARTSLTPAETAEISTKRRSVTLDTTSARVVLPVPGGPHRNSDIGASLSTSRRSGVPGPSRWRWPITSSSVRGRMRTARGCGVASSAAESNKLSTFARLQRPHGSRARVPRQEDLVGGHRGGHHGQSGQYRGACLAEPVAAGGVDERQRHQAEPGGREQQGDGVRLVGVDPAAEFAPGGGEAGGLEALPALPGGEHRGGGGE